MSQTSFGKGSQGLTWFYSRPEEYIQHVWPRTEEGVRRGAKANFTQGGAVPGGMSISGERMFNQEEVAIEMRDFSLRD